MLKYLKEETNYTTTENGALTYKTSGNFCLDLFSTIGALRTSHSCDIISRFDKAYNESPDTAMKILFYARDIRGGLGERRVFNIIINYIATHYPKSVKKNIKYIPEFGRYDDLLSLLDTPCQSELIEFISNQLKTDLKAMEENKKEVSLLAKWLPSINTSNADAVSKAKKISKLLGMSYKQYRQTLSSLRKYIDIIENYLRQENYTFDYEKQTSKSLFKYKKAFIRNDYDRYINFLNAVKEGKTQLKTSNLYPYDIIRECMKALSQTEKETLNITWDSLPNYCKEDENSIAVIDGSGSMYYYGNPKPIQIALSLGIYFAQRCKGKFNNHFITFSTKPQLVEIKGNTIFDKVKYCEKFDEASNTDIQKVFELILNTAVKNKLPQSELPSKIYIISDMEFDSCTDNRTNFEYAKKIYKDKNYKLPQLVFWNVQSRQEQVPVKMNENGVILVSGSSPKIFNMVISGSFNPYEYMIKIISNSRYSMIKA